MSQFTQIVELTPAQARVISQALNAWECVIDGDVDGKRRAPWDHFAMDEDEGIYVPGALTHERGYRALLGTARTTMERIAVSHES